MSAYSFIASDYELPELDNSKVKIITVSEAIELGINPHEFIPWESMDKDDKVLIVENEDDLGELVIKKGTEYKKNVDWYTDKQFIYSVEFRYTEKRAQELLQYLKVNIISGHPLELWLIWLDHKQNIEPIFCKYNEISLDNIKVMYDWKDNNHKIYNCLILEN